MTKSDIIARLEEEIKELQRKPKVATLEVITVLEQIIKEIKESMENETKLPAETTVELPATPKKKIVIKKK